MEPFSLWPFAVLALFLGYIFGAVHEPQNLVRIWRRCGPVRSTAYGFATLCVVGLLIGGLFILVLILPLENGAIGIRSLLVLIILFGTMVALSYGVAFVSFRFISRRSKRRITVEIQD